MTTRLPLSMLKGKVVTEIRLVPPVTRIYYTDGTYTDVLKPGVQDYMNRMTALEQAFNDHANLEVPAAHNGLGDGGTSPVQGPFEAVFRVLPAPPALIRMKSNDRRLAISDIFTVELELINRTTLGYSEIAFLIQAPFGLKFFDDTAEITLPVSGNPGGVHNNDIQSYSGFYLPAGQRGKFTVLAQQGFGAPINTTTALSIQLTNLEYKIGGGGLQKHPVLPLSASYQIVP